MLLDSILHLLHLVNLFSHWHLHTSDNFLWPLSHFQFIYTILQHPQNMIELQDNLETILIILFLQLFHLFCTGYQPPFSFFNQIPEIPFFLIF